MICPDEYFDLNETAFTDFYDGSECVWDGLDRMGPYLETHLNPNIGPIRDKYPDFIPKTVVLFEGKLYEDGFSLKPGDVTKGKFKVFVHGQEAPGAVVIYGGACLPDEAVEISPGVVIETGAVIKAPSFIGPGAEVRQGAYLRGNCLIGRACVVGHVTEVKNALFFEEAKAGHFAYVGDSILGFRVNLGAGTKLANLKITTNPTILRDGPDTYEIKRRKFGAILGDDTELGCNTVTNPGSVLGPRCLAAPNSTIPAGIHRPRSVFRQC